MASKWDSYSNYSSRGSSRASSSGFQDQQRRTSNSRRASAQPSSSQRSSSARSLGASRTFTNRNTDRSKKGQYTRTTRTGSVSAARTTNARVTNPSSGGAAQRRSSASSQSRPSNRGSNANPRSLNGSSNSRNAHAKNARSKNPRKKNSLSLREKILTSRPIMITLGVIAVVLVVCIADTIINWDKAYGNISINGMNVSGMSRQEITQKVEEEFLTPLANVQVMVYADERSHVEGLRLIEAAKNAVNNGDTPEDFNSEDVDFWLTDAVSLKARYKTEEAIDEALAVGRSDGGILKRLSLTFTPVNVDMDLTLNENDVQSLATSIDTAIGDPRKDNTVAISQAWAMVDEGHSGMMVDIPWFTDKLKSALTSGNDFESFQAELSNAPSRITLEQAELMCKQINHALGCEADFNYEGKTFHASDIDLGDWTVVSVVEDGNGYKLQPSLNVEEALPKIEDGANARVTAEDTSCTFESTPQGIKVYLSGTGRFPEVAAAVHDLNQELYGPDGYCYTDKTPQTIDVAIEDSDLPSELSLEEAINQGIVCKIGEFTTQFSNYYGTENRNHNIKLAADILNNGIIKGNGGTWSFNDRSGDTNEAAGFWSAGSIVEGEVVDSIGGGICQVATTIFNAVYEAGLRVTERHNHTLYMANYPDGRDASVSYPDLNFSWRNDLSSDILMVMSYTDTSITCSLYSIYTGYYAKSDVGEWQEGEEFGYRFKEDPSLAAEAYSLKEEGEDGQKISITRTVYDMNGNVVFVDYFSSIYDPVDETYYVGVGTDTKKLEEKLKKAQYQLDHPEEAEKEDESNSSTQSEQGQDSAQTTS